MNEYVHCILLINFKSYITLICCILIKYYTRGAVVTLFNKINSIYIPKDIHHLPPNRSYQITEINVIVRLN